MEILINPFLAYTFSAVIFGAHRGIPLFYRAHGFVTIGPTGSPLPHSGLAADGAPEVKTSKGTARKRVPSPNYCSENNRSGPRGNGSALPGQPMMPPPAHLSISLFILPSGAHSSTLAPGGKNAGGVRGRALRVRAADSRAQHANRRAPPAPRIFPLGGAAAIAPGNRSAIGASPPHRRALPAAPRAIGLPACPSHAAAPPPAGGEASAAGRESGAPAACAPRERRGPPGHRDAPPPRCAAPGCLRSAVNAARHSSSPGAAGPAGG